MILTCCAFGVLATSLLHSVTTSALPDFNSPLIKSSNVSSTLLGDDLPLTNTPTLNISAVPGAQPFEYYLRTALREIVQPGVPNPYLTFVSARPFQDSAATTDVTDFVKLKISYGIEGRYFISNWNARHVEDLKRWSWQSVDVNFHRLDGLEPFPVGDLRVTLYQAGQRLRDAGWGGVAWIAMAVGMFKNTPVGHLREPFFVFARERAEEDEPVVWVYVGANTGTVIQDEGPNELSKRISTIAEA